MERVAKKHWGEPKGAVTAKMCVEQSMNLRRDSPTEPLETSGPGKCQLCWAGMRSEEDNREILWTSSYYPSSNPGGKFLNGKSWDPGQLSLGEGRQVWISSYVSRTWLCWRRRIQLMTFAQVLSTSPPFLFFNGSLWASNWSLQTWDHRSLLVTKRRQSNISGSQSILLDTRWCVLTYPID